MTFALTLLQLGPLALTELGPSALQYIYSNTYVVIYEGTDLFEQGCATVIPPAQQSTWPIGSIQTNYPYCRVALRYRMDDPRANPQLAQLVATAPIISIKLMLDGCDLRLPISVSYSVTEPLPVGGCAVALYPGSTADELLLIVDTSLLQLPARFTFKVTNGSVTREFWIGLRSSRSGAPSGSRIPELS